ncbi:hypothetical protein [Nocardioides ferulae]|uniref:hypothetical protein n=1 Tax=Nocardioides ferulae TaxID=2340821 RepID=UPI000EAFCE2E|nr:hypothetical protein [Nocardioides ferulae]
MTTDMTFQASGCTGSVPDPDTLPAPARALLADLLPGAPSQIAALAELLDRPATGAAESGQWRWEVRRRLGAVHELLAREADPAAGTWLAARGGSVLRQRAALLARVRTLAGVLVDEGDPRQLRHEVLRLSFDLVHHAQRVRDLAYDEIELELGGSE